MNSSRRLVLLGVLCATAACDDMQNPVNATDPTAQATISDGAHNGGNPHFYFLPPLARSPQPTGVFDAAAQPVVEICAVAGTVCPQPPVARFTTQSAGPGERVNVSPAEGQYSVNWHTGRYPLTASVYRIRVLLRGAELGYVDVTLTRDKGARSNTDGARINPGATLPIKFRIEEGALRVPGVVRIEPAPSTIEADSAAQLTASVLDLVGDPLAAAVDWSSSDETVATVDTRGVVRGITVGTTVIVARAGGKSDSATIMVVRPFRNMSLVALQDSSMPAIALHRDGSLMAALIEPSSGHFAGAIARMPGGQSFTVWTTPEGRPVRAYSQGHTFLFSNWTMTTVDIAVIRPDGVTEIRRGVAIPGATALGMSGGSRLALQTSTASAAGSQAALFGFDFLRALTPQDLKWLHLAGAALSTAACAAAAFSSAGAAGLICVGAVVETWSLLLPEIVQEDPYVWASSTAYGYLSTLANVDGCLSAQYWDCAALTYGTLTLLLDAAVEDQEANAPAIDEARQTLLAVRIEAAGGDGQTGAPGAPLASPIVIRVVDAAGVGLQGIQVTFSVTSGGGDLQAPQVYTGANGLAGTGWRLGSQSGEQTASASVDGLIGSPIVFRATAVAAPQFARTISTGADHTCATMADGKAYCWGSDARGNLGNEPGASSSRPYPVASNAAFIAIGAGGEGAENLLTEFSCGITTDRLAYCWGSNDYGELGTSVTTCGFQKQGACTPVPVEGNHRFISITLGSLHACAINEELLAYCWGFNGFGAVGAGPGGARTYSAPHPVVGGLRFTTVTAGREFTCGLTIGSEVYCWGSGATSPQPSQPGGRFRALSAGAFHMCGIDLDGHAWCWGSNGSGQLGRGSIGGESAMPVAVVGGHQFTSIEAGNAHTCAIATSGTAFCWGQGDVGQLGNGEYTSSGSPVEVGSGLTFRAVSAGGGFSCGISTGGPMYCWGFNGLVGKLGNQSTAPSAVPVRVADPVQL
jgi:alpha-tubulin suppressor-like RCC1 family protein